MKVKVTVMLGGPSAEREVSLRSGAAVAQALRSLGHDVRELDPKDEAWALPPGTEVVFLALHGTYGEDGTVQQRLEELGVPHKEVEPGLFVADGPHACSKLIAAACDGSRASP